ncbi:MAG: hypothetical protein AB7R89_34975, partial [Dehalococcoidia bacterium]
MLRPMQPKFREQGRHPFLNLLDDGSIAGAGVRQNREQRLHLDEEPAMLGLQPADAETGLRRRLEQLTQQPVIGLGCGQVRT